MLYGSLTHSLAQRSALSNGNLITLLNTECWRDVRSKVLVPLLVSRVFCDEVEVFASDDKGAVHLRGTDSASQDTTTDADISNEWALLVFKRERVSKFRLFAFPGAASYRCSCPQWRSLAS